jgi:hypothetical protein
MPNNEHDLINAQPGFGYRTPEEAWAAHEAMHPPIRQWYPVKTTTDKLALVFEHIADNDGRVELVHHVGGRDYLVCYSKPVTR